MKKRTGRLLILICLLICIFCAALIQGRAFNRVCVSGCAVRGVDVSEYQGQIDWAVLHDEEISFAFIKATEGSSYTDPYFDVNWSNARENGILTGAYHFFSFDSEAGTQADNFISTVPYTEDSLPSVVDIEFYGSYKRTKPANKDLVISELGCLLDRLESAYGKRPIIYATVSAYREYISGHFDDYPVWIRSVYVPASWWIGNNWTFWQYTDRAKLPGYSGPESCIDMNVFSGEYEDLVLLSNN
ncbi:MAG: GH25 family lysozyme [Clostridia bacterium]|nr:GH25 family lysozyme [Clostridia bacterium]